MATTPPPKPIEDMQFEEKETVEGQREDKKE